MKKHINARESWERFDGEKFTDMLNVKIYFVNVIIFAEYIDLLIIISLRLIYHYIKDKGFFPYNWYLRLHLQIWSFTK